ncbi:MAG: hypothetical protein EOP31_07035 [Rhodococcus sp. (in: high G+C Gram-positive bacteria)]|nr:MAG: hypothetical protein EOP31_07035 [Rhodococcus sp. (in: high G+C Gram-positive bacteria)]
MQRRDTHPLRRGLSAKTKVTLIVLLVLALLLRPVLLVVLLLALIVTGLVGFAPMEKGDVRDPWAVVIAGANTPAVKRYRTSILSWVQGLVHVLHPARMRRQIRPCGTHRSTATSRSWPREVLIRPRYVAVETLLRRFELLPVQLGAEQGVGFRGISHRSIVPDATGKFL